MKIKILKHKLHVAIKITLALLYLHSVCHGQWKIIGQKEIEVKCSKDLVEAKKNKLLIPGIPDVWYELTTIGICNGKTKELYEIKNIGVFTYLNNNISIGVSVKCNSSNRNTSASDIFAIRDGSKICNAGEGIEIAMYAPKSDNPDDYIYRGILTMYAKDLNEDMELSDAEGSDVELKMGQEIKDTTMITCGMEHLMLTPLSLKF